MLRKASCSSERKGFDWPISSPRRRGARAGRSRSMGVVMGRLDRRSYGAPGAKAKRRQAAFPTLPVADADGRHEERMARDRDDDREEGGGESGIGKVRLD